MSPSLNGVDPTLAVIVNTIARTPFLYFLVSCHTKILFFFDIHSMLIKLILPVPFSHFRHSPHRGLGYPIIDGINVVATHLVPTCFSAARGIVAA